MENTALVFKEDHVYGEILLYSNDKEAGKMDISVTDGKLRVYHTEVGANYQGRGFAKILLEKLVSYAKDNQLRIIPLCPFVLSQFKLHPEEYANVWLKKSK